LDQLLALYDAGTKQASTESVDTPEQGVTANTGAPEQGLDQQIAQLLGPDPRLPQLQAQSAELQNQNAQLLEQINNERVQKAYSDLTADISREVPHVSRQVIEDKLEAKAARNPEAAFAWRNQFADKNAANRELLMAEAKLANLQRNPALAKPGEVEQLTQHAYQCGLVLNASKIIARERAAAIRELRGEPPELDWSATYDRNMVAASVRDGGSGGKIPPSPPPDFGKMDDREFYQWKKEHLGWT
jgi:hypothetical protein